MKLEIDRQEATEALLKWVGEKFPNTFNTVDYETGYNTIRTVTFSYEEPEKAEPTE